MTPRRNDNFIEVPEPMVMKLVVSELLVDYVYQHKPYRDAILDLGKNFQAHLCGLILVNIRADGRKFIIDGASRVQVHIDKGIRYIWAEVMRGLTVQQEAAVYLIRAKNKQRQPVDWFHASVIAGDPECLIIQSILDERKIGIVSFATERGTPDYKATMSCVQTLLRIVRRDPSGHRLSETLDLILDTWGYAKAGLSKGFLESIHGFLAQHANEISRPSFISKVGATEIVDILEMARGLRFNTIPRMSLRSATQRNIVELYNVGRSKGRIVNDA